MPIQLLDFIFLIMKNREFGIVVNACTPTELMQSIQETKDEEKKVYFAPNDYKLLFDILHQLKEDKYINYDNEVTFHDRKYYTTFKGGLHSLNGGYSMEYLTKNLEKEHLEWLEKSGQKNNRWMRVWTFVVAMAAIHTMMIDTAKHYHTLVKFGFGWVLSIQLMTFLYVACLALVAGILLGAILMELLHRRKSQNR